MAHSDHALRHVLHSVNGRVCRRRAKSDSADRLVRRFAKVDRLDNTAQVQIRRPIQNLRAFGCLGYSGYSESVADISPFGRLIYGVWHATRPCDSH